MTKALFESPIDTRERWICLAANLSIGMVLVNTLLFMLVLKLSGLGKLSGSTLSWMEALHRSFLFSSTFALTATITILVVTFVKDTYTYRRLQPVVAIFPDRLSVRFPGEEVAILFENLINTAFWSVGFFGLRKIDFPSEDLADKRNGKSGVGSPKDKKGRSLMFIGSARSLFSDPSDSGDTRGRGKDSIVLLRSNSSKRRIFIQYQPTERSRFWADNWEMITTVAGALLLFLIALKLCSVFLIGPLWFKAFQDNTWTSKWMSSATLFGLLFGCFLLPFTLLWCVLVRPRFASILARKLRTGTVLAISPTDPDGFYAVLTAAIRKYRNPV